MNSLLRIELIFVAIIFLSIILWILKKENLLVKYALVWIISSLFMIIAVLIPNFIERVSSFLGFETTSNMIFFVGIMLLLIIVLTLTIIVSKQTQKIKLLIQEVSILKMKVDNKK